MNKLIYLAPLFIISAFGMQQRIFERSDFENEFSVKIEEVENLKGFGTGSGSVFPKKGYKFIGLYVLFSNTTSETHELDMGNLYMLDTLNKIKYKASYV